MKFEEELEEQMISEWKEFYINYHLLYDLYFNSLAAISSK